MLSLSSNNLHNKEFAALSVKTKSKNVSGEKYLLPPSLVGMGGGFPENDVIQK